MHLESLLWGWLYVHHLPRVLFYLSWIVRRYEKTDISRHAVAGSFLRLPAEAGTRVYLIAGQSNATGMGLSSKLTAKEACIPANVEYWASINGQPNDHRLLSSHRDIAQFGLEVSLLKHLAKHYPNDRLIVIKVSLSSSTMVDWSQGGKMHGLFFDTVRSIIGSEPVSYSGVIWMQGETDSRSIENASQYEQKLESFISDLRTFTKKPKLTISIGLISPPILSYPYQYQVINSQLRIAKYDPYARAVTTAGLDKVKGDIHYNKAGLLELGKRFYLTMMGI
ncbi:MAG: sialate O-acetylesterase [Syntrophobacteraceae bacterium]